MSCLFEAWKTVIQRRKGYCEKQNGREQCVKLLATKYRDRSDSHCKSEQWTVLARRSDGAPIVLELFILRDV